MQEYKITEENDPSLTYCFNTPHCSYRKNMDKYSTEKKLTVQDLSNTRLNIYGRCIHDIQDPCRQSSTWHQYQLHLVAYRGPTAPPVSKIQNTWLV